MRYSRLSISRDEEINLCTQIVKVVGQRETFSALARLDSGADSNFVSYDGIENWDMQGGIRGLHKRYTLTLANGTQGCALGQIRLDWYVDDSEELELFSSTFFVLRGLQSDIIIGVHEAVKRNMIHVN
jgi:hypothetical protein